MAGLVSWVEMLWRCCGDGRLSWDCVTCRLGREKDLEGRRRGVGGGCECVVEVNAWTVLNGSVKDRPCGLPRLLSGFHMLLNRCVWIWVPGAL